MSFCDELHQGGLCCKTDIFLVFADELESKSWCLRQQERDGLLPNLCLHLMFAASPNLSNRLKWSLGFKQMVGLEMWLCQSCCSPGLLSVHAMPSPVLEAPLGCPFYPSCSVPSSIPFLCSRKKMGCRRARHSGAARCCFPEPLQHSAGLSPSQRSHWSVWVSLKNPLINTCEPK